MTTKYQSLIEAQLRRLKGRWPLVRRRLRLADDAAVPESMSELEQLWGDRAEDGVWAAGGYYNELKDIIRTLESLRDIDSPVGN